MEDINQVLQTLEESMTQIVNSHNLRDSSSVSALARHIKDQVDHIDNSEQLPKPTKAKLAYFKGKALSLTETYDKSAEDLLTKSIRLDPKNSDAWSALGEVFYTKKDYTQARRCFEGSLEQSGPNKETLRKLSIVYRFLEGPEEKKDLVIKSIELAKQALNLDLTDGESWYILGNAHLTNFFTNSTSYEDIDRALRSYSQSLKYKSTPNPDLHFNRSLALNAAGLYTEAINELRIVETVDPALQAGGKIEEVNKNIENIFDMIQKKCNIKKRVLNGLCKNIPCQLKNPGALALVGVSELVEGKNGGKMVSFKILGYSKLEFPPIFVGCDFRGEFFAVSIYSFPKQGRVALGSTVFVVEPFVISVRNGKVDFVSVQVRDPEKIQFEVGNDGAGSRR